MKLIILDRDGVINHDRDDYVKSADECVPIEGSIDAIARLHQAGFTIVVATNQSGLAREKFDLDDLEAMHEKITGLVEEAGGEISAIFYCPHVPEDNCKCRKPKTGLVDAIEAEFNISAEGFYFVGDSLRDLQAGAQKSCKLGLVRTGNGLKTLSQLSNPELQTNNPMLDIREIFVFENLKHFADVILSVND